MHLTAHRHIWKLCISCNSKSKVKSAGTWIQKQPKAWCDPSAWEWVNTADARQKCFVKDQPVKSILSGCAQTLISPGYKPLGTILVTQSHEPDSTHLNIWDSRTVIFNAITVIVWSLLNDCLPQIIAAKPTKSSIHNDLIHFSLWSLNNQSRNPFYFNNYVFLSETGYSVRIFLDGIRFCPSGTEWIIMWALSIWFLKTLLKYLLPVNINQ